MLLSRDKAFSRAFFYCGMCFLSLHSGNEIYKWSSFFVNSDRGSLHYFRFDWFYLLIFKVINSSEAWIETELNFVTQSNPLGVEGIGGPFLVGFFKFF